MVQSYLRYEHEESFGVISSPAGNVLYDKTGKFAIAPALENIIVWNIRQGTQERVLKGTDGEVMSLALSQDGSTLAAGYSNGVIRIFTLCNGKLLVTLDGHKSHVETLCFNADGSVLASGARDTQIIVWDLVTQSGLYRLKGHRDAVTCVRFITPDQKLLVSSSKDTLLKVWDLETQHCVQTCVGHRSEIWSFDVSKDHTRIATCSSDNQLRIYAVSAQDVTSSEAQVLSYLGSLFRQSNERASQLAFGPTGKYMACQTVGKCVELYKLRTEAEMKKRQARRLKRQREKAKAKGGEERVAAQETAAATTVPDDPVNDEFELVTVVRTTHKLRSFCFCPVSPLSLLLGLVNNSVEVYSIDPTTPSAERSHSVALQGHRSDVRNVALSSDNLLILSLSSSSVKIWNARSMQCVRTMSTSLALCGVFAPGNRHVVIGTKAGKIQVFDLASGQCTMESEAAHEGAVWSIDLRPDGKGIVSGGADHEVKFWDFDMVLPSEGSQVRTLSVVHTRTLKMSDDVLCVRYSHAKDASKLLVAVALLDCTVKIFYDDSLKFFLSLYGHKLPVMAMDISSDDSMLVTASADKNVKLWGLDFGDCHKSIFAHDNSIMAVRFVHNTHYFFTASKDKSIKYWDADTFERILTLKSHFGEVWALAVSSDGSYLISVSHDRSLRKWVRTNDQVFLEEEREKELEQMFDSELNGKTTPQDGGDAETAPAGKRSVETVKAGEQLMEALELADAENQVEREFQQRLEAAEAALSATERRDRAAALQRQKMGETMKEGDAVWLKPLVVKPKPNMLLLGFTPMKYVLRSLTRIRSHELEEALIVLPFDVVKRLISYLLQLVRANIKTETCLNCLLYLLRVHHEQIIANRSLLKELDEMWSHLRRHIAQDKDNVGFNLAGMRFLKRRLVQKQTVYLSSDSLTTKKAKV